MPLKAYEEWAQEPLAFPIAGKVYTVLPVGIQVGILLEQAIAADGNPDADDPLKGKTGEDLWRMLLGPVWDQMVADNVPRDAANRAGYTVLVDFQFGRDAATAAWEAGADPEALAAAMAANQTVVSPPSPSTGSGKRTRSRASSPSTTSPAA